MMAIKTNKTPCLTINFVSHLNPFYFNGGGEQITKAIINEGLNRMHDIRIVAMKPKKLRLISRIRMHRNPDLWILFDVFNCPKERKHFRRPFINKIISSGRYVFGQNAYVDTCSLDYLPCNGNIGNGNICVEKKEDYYGYRGNNRGWKNGYCPVNDNRELFSRALLNVFLSPLHASIFYKIYAETKYKFYILKPLIDANIFTNKNMKRDIKYASYGGMNEAKGFYNIKKIYSNEKIVFFGSKTSPLVEKYKYGNVIGRIPYSEMPDFLNKVQNYIHLPRWPEPHGLIVNQAALCGCKLITNENVGALSHNQDIFNRQTYRNSSAEFWEKVNEVLN